MHDITRLQNDLSLLRKELDQATFNDTTLIEVQKIRARIKQLETVLIIYQPETLNPN